MPKLPVLSGIEVVKILQHAGFTHMRTTGSHAIMRNKSKVIPVPLHPELAKGTLLSIIRQSGMKKEEFFELRE
jgi:predicted RNA binding protein YcfA (HicA-like mRNA interferase family)